LPQTLISLALGQISLTYNLLEFAMSSIFVHTVPSEYTFAIKLFHKLGNRDRVDLISALLHQNEKRQDMRNALLHFILCYDICTENRNIIMHAVVEDLDRAALRFSKRASKDPLREVIYHAPLNDLRLIADQNAETFFFGMELHRILFHASKATSAVGSPPSPDILSKPHKLTPYQPPTTVQASPLPPQSSQE
jgi:hypothetical protein